MNFKKHKSLLHRIKNIWNSNLKHKGFNSKKYWEQRYHSKLTSGTGSYGRLAEFKAEVINKFVEEHSIKSIIDLGCGDGNQLKLAKYPNHIGFDVTNEAIKICENKFKTDKSKAFFNYKILKKKEFQAELLISLEVIFHLIEDAVYHEYMINLFKLSSKYVIIYSSNYNEIIADHVVCRKFTDWVDENQKDKFALIQNIKNRFPFDENDQSHTAFSEFFIYKKIK